MMTSTRRPDLAVIAAFGLMAMLAIAAPLTHVPPGFRLFAVLGGVLLGPASLSYRMATRHRWTECLAVGATINVAIVMLLGEVLVAAHFWHPVPFELFIPVTTVLLSAALLRQPVPSSPGARHEMPRSPGARR
jgi:hypothetical protein